MAKMYGLILSLVVMYGVSVWGQSRHESDLKDHLHADLQYIAKIFDNYYAPKSWKENFFKWNLADELKKAQDKIDKAQSVFEYRQAVADFINSTSDYHVGFRFYSTEQSSLPFQVKTVEGKSLVVYIDRAKLPADRFDLEEGDEVVSFDGVPQEDLRQQLRTYFGNNVKGTDEALLDFTMTRRSAARNQMVPRGPVTVGYKKPGRDTVSFVQISWMYAPEQIPGLQLNILSETSDVKQALPSPMMISQGALQAAGDSNPYGLGVRESFLPDFGTRIWETAKDSFFDAYIYQNEEGKLIGVVRIPSYVPGTPSSSMGEDDSNYEKAADAFAGIVKKMQATTSALVIDQLNNPGGAVFYLYALASMLTDQGLVTPRHHMAMTYEMAQETLGLLSSLKDIKNDEDAVKALGKTNEGYPVSYQMVKMMESFAHFYLSQWQSGKKLSDAHYIYGVDRINPHPTARYTKPVLVLVNELDFSGGDFFPTILQDNKRALIVGTRTAGAGGWVNSLKFPNSVGLQTLNYTGSIAERVDKNPIENLGVKPDVSIPMTVSDYRENFAGYVKAVKAEVKKLSK